MSKQRISVAAASKAASSVCACVAAVALLAACGQKGPLALAKPVIDEAPVAVSPSSAPASASAARP